MNNLASTYYHMGAYEKAISLDKRALSIREKTLGTEHPDTAGALNHLAENYRAMGNDTKALPLNEKALAIYEKTLGPVNPSTAGALSYLANNYLAMGNYTKALPLNEKALAIYEKTLGPVNPSTEWQLIHLAGVYESMANYTKALPLYERALAISEKVLGPEHMDTAISLFHIANCHMDMGNYTKALPYIKRALAICEKVVGPEDRSTANAFIYLANYYQSMGNYTEAFPLYGRALAIYEKRPGVGASYALNRQAENYRCVGNYTKALTLNEQALEISEKTFGPGHQDTLESWIAIALDQYLMGSDLHVIRDRLTKGYSGRERALQFILTMDEETRLAWQKRHLDFPLIDLLCDEQRCQCILRIKGIVLDSLIGDQRMVKSLGQESPAAIELATDRVRIGKLAFSAKKEDQEEIIRLKARIDSILSSAAGQRGKVGRVRESATITPDVVASALPEGGLLLEFIQFSDPKIKGDAGRCYGALILGRDGKSKFVRIDDAAGIDASIRILRETIAKGDEKPFSYQHKLLSEKLWAPVAKALPEGTKKLFIGADGQLNFLSFATLPAPDGGLLAEHYDFAYAGSGRDLARRVSPSGSKTVALFADPVFDRQAANFSTNTLAFRSSEVDAFGKIVLPPLPGTRVEEAAVEEVAKAGGWFPEANLGVAANKSAIENLKSPGILHLATHGFYLNTLPANGSDGERGMRVMEAPDLSGKKHALLPKIDPMHASGIALTGAQSTLKAWSEGRVPNPSEDGILTADEVGALNLDGTWLVTLSACETGVGEARSGEGVFGLRRAFMIAGAQNLLMTLWPVNDEVTPKIMADFYKEALATHDAAGSLAKVQRDWLMKLRKEKGLLAAVRDAGPFAMVVMAKQDSTFSSPSTATPMTSDPSPTSTDQSASTNATPMPEVLPSSNSTPAPEVLVPASTPIPSPSPSISPGSSAVIIEQAPLKKAA